MSRRSLRGDNDDTADGVVTAVTTKIIIIIIIAI